MCVCVVVEENVANEETTVPFSFRFCCFSVLSKVQRDFFIVLFFSLLRTVSNEIAPFCVRHPRKKGQKKHTEF